MADEPSTHELARDLSQLERQWDGRLTAIEKSLTGIRQDTASILAEQARARQAGTDLERRVERVESDQTSNRRMVVGSLLFPIVVIIVGALLTVGGGA